MDSILNRYQAVKAQIAQICEVAGRLPEEVLLLAVSKRQRVEDIQTLFEAGQFDFGENVLQEALGKIEQLSSLSIIWHYIGQIQSNKTRQIARHFDWVHSVDRLKIAQRLSEQRPMNLVPLNICIQVNLEKEAQKAGVYEKELPDLALKVSKLPHLKLRGLMLIPKKTENKNHLKAEFLRLVELKNQLNKDGLALDTLSMGMSSDLEEAVQSGTTLVRIGTAIFGKRD